MNIVIHFNAATSGIQQVDEAQTWGQVCQHFCETKLLHPPQLLQLLTSLHPDGRMSRYQLRYGDGYATIVRPIWNEEGGGLNAKMAVNHDINVMVEANVILKPRDAGGSGPFSRMHHLSQARVAAPFTIGRNSEDETAQRENIDVDLWIEKVEKEGSAALLPFPSTQTPFPTDDSKTNVMFISEHPQFNGLVDKVSIEKANAQNLSRGCADKFLRKGDLVSGFGNSRGFIESNTKHEEDPNDIPDKVVSGEKREERPSENRASTKEGGKNEKQEVKGKAKDKSSKKTNASTESAVKDYDETQQKPPQKSSNKTTASTEVQKLGKKGVSEKIPNKSPRKKHQASDEKTSTAVDIALPDATSPKSARKQTEQPRPPSSTSPPFKISTKKESTAKKGEDAALKNETKLKRPLNGYMTFAGDVRPKLMKEHPELKMSEVSKKIGELYRALGADERKKYNDAAKTALDKFNEEHPNLPKTTRKKKKKVQAKEEEEKEQEGEENVAVCNRRKKKVKVQAKEEGEENAAVLNGRKNKIKVQAKEEKEEEEEQEGEENIAVCNGEDTGNDEQRGEDTKEEDQPKRPVNGYMRFSMEIRPKIKEENPDASPKEVMTKAAEAYRALDDDQKKQYKDAADAAMVKFYGNGLPEGWTARNIPRKTGDRSDMFWFSPVKSFKFRSKAQTKRFLDILENAGGGDEVATMELFSKGEKEKRPADNNSSDKKLKTMSDKKKKKKAAVDIKSEKDFGHVSGNNSKGEKEKRAADNNSSDKKQKTMSDKKKKKKAGDIKRDKDFGHASDNDSKGDKEKDFGHMSGNNSKGEKEKRAADNNSRDKKRKTMSDKRKKKKAGDIKRDKNFGHVSDNDSKGDKEKRTADNNSSGKKRKTMSDKKKKRVAADIKSDKDFEHVSNNDSKGETEKNAADNNSSGKKQKRMSDKKKKKKAAVVIKSDKDLDIE